MRPFNPMVSKWIPKLDDWDQSSSFSAWQSIEREVLHSTKPGNEESSAALAKELADALVAPGDEPEGQQRRRKYRYSPGARRLLARMLGYVPCDAILPQLGEALKDLDAREMARYALESNPSPAATDLLIGALEQPGAVFRVGVVNSLAKRSGAKVLATLKRCAADPQLEVRIAASEALAGVAEPALDTILQRATESEQTEEQLRAHVARARLAETLRAAGRGSEARKICASILDGDAPGPQKASAQRTLDQLS